MKVTIQWIVVRATCTYIITVYTRNQRLERHGHADKGKVKMTVTMPLLVLKLKFILAIFYPFLSHLVGMQDYI